ncbi:MAG: radical SAM protein [Verrucomicrobiales bacterium]|nr:radical SAM protein [Verrucomicrobiales bacterium]
MINLTRLWTGQAQPADYLRYGEGDQAPKSSAARRPIVVWNITRTCNLRCVHCYSDSDRRNYPGELTWDENIRVLDDLAQFQIPGLLFSGGEPMVHPRFFELAKEARSRGLRLTLSTNGTLINPANAERLKELDFAYVGISLDGIGAVHDAFRRTEGSFERAVAAFRNCKAAGQKTGLRFTLTKHNVANLEPVLDFIEQEDISRVCFYHLVPSGRGGELQLLTPQEARNTVDMLLDRVGKWAAAGRPREVLTVTQPADGVYLLLRQQREHPELAPETHRLLSWNSGSNAGSGMGLGNIDSQGEVHADQFSQSWSLGNVRKRPFSEIWQDTSSHERLAVLRGQGGAIKGRCGSCRFLDLCGGGFRQRAATLTGDPLGSDPCCPLTDEEIFDQAICAA